MRYDIGNDVLTSSLQGNCQSFNTTCNATFQWYNKFWNQKTDFTLISENPMPWTKATNFASKNFKTAIMTTSISPEKTLNLIKGQSEPILLHLIPPHLPFIYGEGKVLCDKLKQKHQNIYLAIQTWGRQKGFKKLKIYYKEQIEQTVKILKANCEIFVNKRVLITSDHGELLGWNNYQYDHPHAATGKKAEILQNVPWFEWNIEAELIQKRLQELGY